MKITVAFYGIPRCTAVSAPSIERHVLGPLARVGEVAVVHHLWRLTEVKSARSGEDAPIAADAYDYFRQFPGVVEAPTAVEDSPEFAAWKAFGDAFDDGFASLRNLMHQLRSLKAVTGLAAATRPDVVVFARPDLQYHEDVPASACRLVARRPRCCVLPIWNWWGGFNDRFSVCGRDAFHAYGERLDRAVDFARARRRPVHSESLLRFALRQGGVTTLGMPLRASRVRVDGRVKEEDFDSIATSGPWNDKFSRWRVRLAREVSKRLFADAAWHER